MECEILKENINASKTVIDTFSEEKIDFDIVIPEYCAAASKILHCDVMPIITAKSFEKDRLIIDGICKANIIYIDEDNQGLKSICETVDFKQIHQIKGECEKYRVKFKLRAYNVVCRLQNSRRITVRSIVGVAVKATGVYDYELINGFEDCSIESKFENIDYCAYENSGNTNIHINAELQSEHPAICIVSSDVQVKVSDIKMIKDKAIIKGESRICCMYTYSEDLTDLHTIESTVPFSDVIEILGANEVSVCDVSCDVVSFRCDPDNSHENNIINVEIEAVANASIFNKKQIIVLKDAYSKKFEVSTSFETLHFESLVDNLKYEEHFSERIKTDITDAVVQNVRMKPNIKNISINDSSLVIEGDIDIFSVVHNDKDCSATEKPYPFRITKKIDLEFTKLRCEADAQCINIEFSMPNDNEIFVECDIIFDILAFNKVSINAITDIQTLAEKEREDKSRIVLYYANKDETLWDIAKKYSTSVDALKKYNDVESERISKDCMILISSK